MRAWELMKETLWRREYLWIVHLVWLVFYGVFWWLFLPDPEEFGNFVFLWGGFLLPLALSAGIMGDDIASGRICVLVTKPFWLGELYLYRLLGLSVQGALHFVLSAWLLFNTFAALSTSLSVVVKRVHNALLLFVATLTLVVVAALLIHSVQGGALEPVVTGFFRYPFPPFELLGDLGKGEYVKETVTVGSWHIPKSVACAAHSLLLTAIYAGIGIFLFARRQFLSQRE
jgi:hypothetical protein